MNIFKKLFSPLIPRHQALVPSIPSILRNSFHIPQPTLSLLWFTDEPPSKIQSATTINITISLGPDGIRTNIPDRHNFFAEPSLIWTQLPVEQNDELEQDKLYYPSYTGLTPEQRYQYINWLRDVTQETNLSYVFLYYYGLERQLLVGNFDLAAEEILRLLNHHDKGTFRSYAQQALMVAIIHKKRIDFAQNNLSMLEGTSNEVLLIRRFLGENIQPQDIIQLASRVGFTNKRYVKQYPEEFKQELTKLVERFEQRQGSLLDIVPVEELKMSQVSVFANLSLPDEIRSIQLPQLLGHPTFASTLKSLLQDAHQSVKANHHTQKS
ncbi:MAG: TerB N-terminal domain-containing protein [Patescibacteria group bacterium]|jgi:hypothetical protein